MKNNCEACGEQLTLRTGQCLNPDCPEFDLLEDEYGNVRELDFSDDSLDRYGFEEREVFEDIIDHAQEVHESFREDFE